MIGEFVVFMAIRRYIAVHCHEANRIFRHESKVVAVQGLSALCIHRVQTVSGPGGCPEAGHPDWQSCGGPASSRAQATTHAPRSRSEESRLYRWQATRSPASILNKAQTPKNMDCLDSRPVTDLLEGAVSALATFQSRRAQWQQSPPPIYTNLQRQDRLAVRARYVRRSCGAAKSERVLTP